MAAHGGRFSRLGLEELRCGRRKNTERLVVSCVLLPPPANPVAWQRSPRVPHASRKWCLGGVKGNVVAGACGLAKNKQAKEGVCVWPLCGLDVCCSWPLGRCSGQGQASLFAGQQSEGNSLSKLCHVSLCVSSSPLLVLFWFLYPIVLSFTPCNKAAVVHSFHPPSSPTKKPSRRSFATLKATTSALHTLITTHKSRSSRKSSPASYCAQPYRATIASCSSPSTSYL